MSLYAPGDHTPPEPEPGELETKLQRDARLFARDDDEAAWEIICARFAAPPPPAP
jgi:hypothetical protein